MLKKLKEVVKLMKQFKLICTLVAFFVIAGGTGAINFLGYHDAFAEKQWVQMVEGAVLYQQYEYRWELKDNRLWKILDRYGCLTEDLLTCEKPMTPEIREMIRDLKKDRDDISDKQKKYAPLEPQNVK